MAENVEHWINIGLPIRRYKSSNMHCRDDDATELPSLTLGKKLATESPTATVCMLLPPTKQY